MASHSVPALSRIGRETSSRANALVWLLRTTVFLTIVSSAVVFAEPAPVDVLTLGLVIALPLVGLIRIYPLLIVYIAAWLVLASASLIAATVAVESGPATVHTLITLYLCAASFVFAGFVARQPAANTKLILDAYIVAASLAASMGIVGYFGLAGDAGNALTMFGRATGGFKDPNVFGPFLVPALVYLMHLIATRPASRALWPVFLFAYIGFALVLSFSRGAWVNFAIAGSLYWLLSLASTASALLRFRLMGLLALGIAVMLSAVVIALQFDAVATMFDERAALVHTYDLGPQGRFGGQAKAVETILANPLGIGALNFPVLVHHEDPHNVYLSMFLNGGWIGGLLYLAIVLVTMLAGFSHALKRRENQGLYIVTYAALIAIIIEGVVIDTDHWRHFFVLMGVVWGLMAADRAPATSQLLPRRPARITGRFITTIPAWRIPRRPHRPARICGRARPRLPRRIALPRRSRTVVPRRPSRLAYR